MLIVKWDQKHVVENVKITISVELILLKREYFMSLVILGYKSRF